MIKLPTTTLWACCWSDDRDNLRRTVRVLDYCRSIIEPFETMLFTHIVPDCAINWPVRIVEIPMLDWQQWSIFVNRRIPGWIDSEFAMCVHEDGFPIRPDLWDGHFLDYDYIGAPWDPKQSTGWIRADNQDNLIVGNGGFFMWSKRMMNAVQEMPSTFEEFRTASDVYVCRVMRNHFEDLGMKFAPADIAARFSTEQTHKNTPSFGFHGRRDASEKYRQGWKLIEEYERRILQPVR